MLKVCPRTNRFQPSDRSFRMQNFLSKKLFSQSWGTKPQHGRQKQAYCLLSTKQVNSFTPSLCDGMNGACLEVSTSDSTSFNHFLLSLGSIFPTSSQSGTRRLHSTACCLSCVPGPFMLALKCIDLMGSVVTTGWMVLKPGP